MRITYKGDYALKAILALALRYHTGLVTIHELAKTIDAPIKFLEQVLLELKRGGFVVSKRGKVGGYLLSRPPGQIRLGDVVRFIDGPIEPIACLEPGYKGCGDLYKCAFRPIWQEVAEKINGVIDTITFEELVARAHSAQQLVTYSI